LLRDGWHDDCKAVLIPIDRWRFAELWEARDNDWFLSTRWESKERETTMWKWFLLACCMFSFLNWWVLPTFPQLQRQIPALTMQGAIGLSGLLVAVSLIFAKK
jgi:hypothetical protein